jgi:glycosyltransferase involved in cell wall biosynthesis
MLVSILIPCYNAERWIAKAVESALSQTWAGKEVIVVDDGSSDGSLGILKGFGDRIRLESGPNQGGNRARNRLLELSRGTWLQYLDADDYLLPDKITRQVAAIEAHPDTDVLYSPVILEHWTDAGSSTEVLPIPEPHDLWVLLARWYLPQTGAPLWRKQAIVDVGGWKPDQPCSQEHELYLRLLKAGKRFTYFPESGAVYRQWSDQTVCRRDRADLRRRVLEILQLEEDFLRQRNELTADRQWAINVARFEAARIAWLSDKNEARSIMTTVRSTQPGFVPGGVAAPWRYQLLYRLFGFEGTEHVADWIRKFA